MKASASLLFAFLALSAAAAPPVRDDVVLSAALDGRKSDVHETNLGNLVADAVRETAKTPIALVAADEIAPVQIPAGTVSASQVLKALHYADDPNDTVVILSLTGKQILLAAERGVSRVPSAFDGFLQVSGLQVRFDAKSPEGKRVTLAGTGGGEISASQTYKVAVSRPLADGAFGYFRLWGKSAAVENTNVSIARSLTNYLAAHKTINTRVEGRLAAP